MSLPLSFRSLLQQKNILLLQGPIGFFFDSLARTLLASGKNVHKIHFNGGDWMFYDATPASSFRGTDDEWPGFLTDAIQQHNIDAIVLFGQMRKLKVKAREIAKQLGVAVYVFEEGYIRPNYVTLEKDGVNGLSSLPSKRSEYAFWRKTPMFDPAKTGQNFSRTAWLAMAYALAMYISKPFFPHYEHHRCMHPIKEGLRWVRAAFRKYRYQPVDLKVRQHLLSKEQRKNWFIVPLQVHNDSQIMAHSQYESVEDFIRKVVKSFAANADTKYSLVFKHHPLDKPYTDYSKLLANLENAYHLRGRIFYVHDLHLPTLIKRARGMVTINSTAGLQSLFHRCPVKVMGESCYGIPGLTYQGALEDFWSDPGEVNYEFYQRFRSFMIDQTQLNVSFYAGMPALDDIPYHDAVEDGLSPALNLESPGLEQRRIAL